MAAPESSFGAQTYGHGGTPDRKNFWFSLIAVLGCFALFIAVVFVAYLPPNSEDSSGQTEVVEARLARLEEMRAKEATAADTYGWVNQPKGVVRIPIERAVVLFAARAAEGKFSVPATTAPAAASQATDAALAETPAEQPASAPASAESATAPASTESAAAATDSAPAESSGTASTEPAAQETAAVSPVESK